MKWYKKYKALTIVLGLILLPILFAAYIIDRFLIVFLCWMSGPTLFEYFQESHYMLWSFARVITLSIIITIIWLLV